MNIEHVIVTAQDIEHHRRQAQLMQSRELARLIRRLFHVPARLLGRGRPVAPVDRAQAV